MQYFAHSFLSHQLLLSTAFICDHYANIDQNLKTYCCAYNIKMKNNEFKKVHIKNQTCYYVDDIINFEHFDFDNILMDENVIKTFLIMTFIKKTFGC